MPSNQGIKRWNDGEKSGKSQSTRHIRSVGIFDEYEDFVDWTLSEIRQRVELVQDFDRLCDDIVSAFIDTCKNYRITEEEILIPKTIKVLEPIGGG